jgi:hypothetical protein
VTGPTRTSSSAAALLPSASGTPRKSAIYKPAGVAGYVVPVAQVVGYLSSCQPSPCALVSPCARLPFPLRLALARGVAYVRELSLCPGGKTPGAAAYPYAAFGFSARRMRAAAYQLATSWPCRIRKTCQ